jgi:ribosome biogenesis GTPase
MTPDARTQAVVTGAFGRRMTIRLDGDRRADARVRGRRLQPVCGDVVTAEPIPNEADWLITAIEPRSNELARPDSRGRKEVLAANISCVIVMAAPEPQPDWFVVDRYLAAAENMESTGIVVLNKAELPGAGACRDTLAEYESAGYRVLECSAESGANIARVADALAGETAIIVGQSGVGKSSVINRLTAGEAAQRTGPLSGSSGEGRHTTVNSIMIDLPSGGTVIDSPGVRDFAPAVATADEVLRGFPEIDRAGRDCRFANCRHLREPDCAVKAAVDDGTISTRRYESYRRLLRLADELSQKSR